MGEQKKAAVNSQLMAAVSNITVADTLCGSFACQLFDFDIAIGRFEGNSIPAAV